MNESIPTVSQMLAWQQEKDRLPVLQRRTAQLRERLQEIDRRLAEQLRTVAGEQADVDRLQDRSLGNYLLSLSHQMDKHQQKEQQELIQARRKLDEYTHEQKYLRQELSGLEQQILTAQQADAQWQAGLQARAGWLELPENQPLAVAYQAAREQLSQQNKQLAEIDQARSVARSAAETAAAMQKQLDSAEDWSTYDIWFKGGIIAHAAKYDSLDAASELMNHLSAQLVDLRSELADIRMPDGISLNEYSSGTRVLDYFFDNIFTDLSVRDRIRGDQENVRQIIGKLHLLEQELNSRRTAVQASIRQLSLQLEKIVLEAELH